MLEVSIQKTLGNFTLDTSFKAHKGVLGILGSSGCGKSLTLKSLAGLSTPDEGIITLNGQILYSSESKINLPARKRNIGYVFQNYALFPHLTVFKNIAYGISHLDKDTQKKKVVHMIQKMQLAGLENHYPSQLSGGQQQRTALARTLITEPSLLLLDEPFSALDSHIKHLLEKELLNIIKENYDGIVLLVTHNMEEAYRLCNHIMVVDKGKTIQIGTKDDIIFSPKSVAVAQMTSCKNIFKTQVVKEENGYYTLKSNALIFKSTKKHTLKSSSVYAGIRAHTIKVFPSNTVLKENMFSCHILEKTDSIFSTTVIVDASGCILTIEIPKSDSLKITNDSITIYIPPEEIFLMDANKG
ncbi:molybdate transport system ATP-binding protein [Natranaerovirga pectinivora]|uniref:Molybdate transport system ATP-binding protein n=1 Tax=Natranaerovirga pectinivora TaxID=682400 RepID=A0A4R3MND3_9FIRM|nr:ABC transporter ATP-binding protein [Natranaerovirga pectinivora]TCT16765.1 molybdate transport system ATP-binding protein [Natranaerovirga pectinivora]